MMMTTNIFSAASDTLKANDTWYIFTHRKADGDALGSASALYEAGIALGKSIRWYSPDTKLPESYTYLPHYDQHITRENMSFNEADVLYVFLDCANETRSVSGYDINININSLNIDHHEDNSNYCRVNCVDGRASSTAEMLFRVFTAGNWDITKTIAESLYTGLYTDTGCFTFSNTSSLTHNTAAKLIELGVDPGHMSDLISQNKTLSGLNLWARAMSRARTFGPESIFGISMLYSDDLHETGAAVTETEGLPSMLMTLRGVKMIAMITETFSGEIRVSFRSREGSPLKAGETARLLGGGGHERASGASLKWPAENCIDQLEAFILSKYHECSNSD